MRIQVKGEERNLRGLKNEEYELARKLAQKTGEIPIDECPTCGGKKKSIPNSGGVKDFASNSYKDKDGNVVSCDCQTQMALRSRYLLANIGTQYQRLDWDEFDRPKEKAKIDDYVEHWEDHLHHGYGLEIGGGLGIGKTFAATYIAKEMIKHNQTVYFIPFTDMIFVYEKDDDTLEDKFRDATFLVIDEVSVPKTGRQFDLSAERFESMIRHRTNYDLPTIITTNESVDKLESSFPRVYSLLSAKQVRVDFSGTDVRESKGNETAKDVLEGIRRPIT